MCVCALHCAVCTIVAHNTAWNRPNNFPSYLPDIHNCSDDVFWGKGDVITWGFLQTGCYSWHPVSGRALKGTKHNVWVNSSDLYYCGRPKRMWREVVQKDCQVRNLNREDAVDHSRWKNLIKIGWWSGYWVGECFFWYRLTWVVQDKGP